MAKSQDEAADKALGLQLLALSFRLQGSGPDFSVLVWPAFLVLPQAIELPLE